MAFFSSSIRGTISIEFNFLMAFQVLKSGGENVDIAFYLSFARI